MALFAIKPNTTLLRLVTNHPEKFYPQTWYLDEEFANISFKGDYVESQQISLMPPVAWAYLHVFGYNTQDLRNHYAWTSDFDHNGDRVYVGNWGSTGKLQIHRHLTIRPDMFINTI